MSSTSAELTEPRPAGTVIVLRGGASALEVLLVQRNPNARFMGGAWVFPGGAVDRDEGHGDGALRAAAIRELEEEAGISLGDPAQLVAFSRWITPAEVKTRFDTWFYLAPLPPGAAAQPDGGEVVDARWYTPAAALEARTRGELFLVFPTIKHLEQLSMFETADALLAHARGREVAGGRAPRADRGRDGADRAAGRTRLLGLADRLRSCGGGHEPILATVTASLPAEVQAVFDRFITTELTTVDRAGQPITWPVTPYYRPGDPCIDVTTGLGYPKKANDARANPLVSLLFSDPTGSGLDGSADGPRPGVGRGRRP